MSGMEEKEFLKSVTGESRMIATGNHILLYTQHFSMPLVNTN